MNRCDSLSIVSLTINSDMSDSNLSVITLYMASSASYSGGIGANVTTSLHTNLQMQIWKQLGRLSHDTGWHTTPKKGKKGKEEAHNREISLMRIVKSPYS